MNDREDAKKGYEEHKSLCKNLKLSNIWLSVDTNN